MEDETEEKNEKTTTKVDTAATVALSDRLEEGSSPRRPSVASEQSERSFLSDKEEESEEESLSLDVLQDSGNYTTTSLLARESQSTEEEDTPADYGSLNDNNEKKTASEEKEEEEEVASEGTTEIISPEQAIRNLEKDEILPIVGDDDPQPSFVSDITDQQQPPSPSPHDDSESDEQHWKQRVGDLMATQHQQQEELIKFSAEKQKLIDIILKQQTTMEDMERRLEQTSRLTQTTKSELESLKQKLKEILALERRNSSSNNAMESRASVEELQTFVSYIWQAMDVMFQSILSMVPENSSTTTTEIESNEHLESSSPTNTAAESAQNAKHLILFPRIWLILPTSKTSESNDATITSNVKEDRSSQALDSTMSTEKEAEAPPPVDAQDVSDSINDSETEEEPTKTADPQSPPLVVRETLHTIWTLLQQPKSTLSSASVSDDGPTEEKMELYMMDPSSQSALLVQAVEQQRHDPNNNPASTWAKVVSILGSNTNVVVGNVSDDLNAINRRVKKEKRPSNESNSRAEDGHSLELSSPEAMQTEVEAPFSIAEKGPNEEASKEDASLEKEIRSPTNDEDQQPVQTGKKNSKRRESVTVKKWKDRLLARKESQRKLNVEESERTKEELEAISSPPARRKSKVEKWKERLAKKKDQAAMNTLDAKTEDVSGTTKTGDEPPSTPLGDDDAEDAPTKEGHEKSLADPVDASREKASESAPNEIPSDGDAMKNEKPRLDTTPQSSPSRNSTTRDSSSTVMTVEDMDKLLDQAVIKQQSSPRRKVTHCMLVSERPPYSSSSGGNRDEEEHEDLNALSRRVKEERHLQEEKLQKKGQLQAMKHQSSDSATAPEIMWDADINEQDRDLETFQEPSIRGRVSGTLEAYSVPL